MSGVLVTWLLYNHSEAEAWTGISREINMQERYHKTGPRWWVNLVGGMWQLKCGNHHCDSHEEKSGYLIKPPKFSV